jgi:hypothetical protein
MKRRLFALVLGLAVAGSSACVHRSAAQEARDAIAPHTFVRVENQAFLDANVFVIANGGQRQRLGTATGSGTNTFEIPRSIMFGPTQLSFLIDFVGSQRTPISEAITVNPGDTVVLTIPPQ